MAFNWRRAVGSKGAASDGLVDAIVVAQVAIAGALVCLLALLAAQQAAAAALGAAACILPTALFARAATNQRSGGRLLAYGLAKSIAILGLMALCFVLARPEPLGFIAAVVAVHLAYVVTPLVKGRG